MIDTGGPAFPIINDNPSVDARDIFNEGMTLLDYYAGEAIAMIAEKREREKDE